MDLVNLNFGEKRGIWKHVSSVIIAVIVLIFIVYGLVKLYGVFVSQDSEVAKRVLNSIEGKIELLKEGQSAKFPIRGPANWALIGWGKNEDGRPDRCYFKSCICACPTDTTFPSKNEMKEICQEKGLCRFVEAERIEFSVYEPSYSNYVFFQGGLYDKSKDENEANNFRLILFKSNFIELQINKTNGGLIISQTG